MSTNVKLPAALPGHWESGDGRQMAKLYLRLERRELCGAHFSDMGAALQLAVLGRMDAEFEPTLSMGRDRIRWLSVHLANTQAINAELLDAAALAYRVLGKHRLAGTDQNPMGVMDVLGHAVLMAGGDLSS